MKNVYLCPHCHSNLNPSVKIVLVASYRQRKGLILLSPQPGNFKFVCDEHVSEVIKPGTKVKFHCPVCSNDLTSAANKDFAEVFLDTGDKQPRRLYFSRAYGTHATFIDKGDVIAAYGENVEDYDRINFFGS
jgi:hypothetical protein